MSAQFNNLQISQIGYYGDTYAQSRGIFNWNAYGGSGYLQLKTNVGGDDSMWLFELVGYNFGTAAPIRSMITWYSYQGGVYSVGTSNPYSGLSAQRVYPASDWASVIVFYASSYYYAGFTVNAYNVRANTSGQTTPTITASVILGSDYNYY